MCKITIFTPTYNRAKTIEKLYYSLQKQTFKDFEWVIVDDGSNDETKKKINLFINEHNFFPIVYIKQENLGKHVAINNGVSTAKGDLFFIVDSDDFLNEKSLERIVYWEGTIKNKEDFAGIGGLKCHYNGYDLGTTFSGDFIDATSLDRSKYHINGVKAEVFFTKILKEFPFPVFVGEKFLTEAVVWYRIASKGYKIRWFNEKIYFCEYLNDGLSVATGKFKKNFQGFELYVFELIKYKQTPIIQKIKMIGSYGAIARCNSTRKKSFYESSKKIGVNYFLLILFSLLASAYEYLILRRKI